jgi:hypothetical protein
VKSKASSCRKNGVERKYDIRLSNKKSICMIEYLYKYRGVTEVLRKAQTFREDVPEYDKYQLFLGARTNDFTPEFENECIKEGIAIVKQVDNKIVIIDDHIKIF